MSKVNLDEERRALQRMADYDRIPGDEKEDNTGRHPLTPRQKQRFLQCNWVFEQELRPRPPLKITVQTIKRIDGVLRFYGRCPWCDQNLILRFGRPIEVILPMHYKEKNNGNKELPGGNRVKCKGSGREVELV